MTSSGQRLDRLADLEEQRDFLLRSLDDLEAEHAAGELDDDEYRTLKDDYIRRAAEVGRAIDDDQRRLSAGGASRARNLWILAGVAVLAVVAGGIIAQSAGQREPGEVITGDLDASLRSRVADARNLFLRGELADARTAVDEILIDDRDLTEALLLSAQIHERNGEVLEALEALQAVLDDQPDHIDALTLRGWILVRIDDPELVRQGIAALDAAISLGPTVPDPFLFRGLTARELEGDLDAAIGYYRAALERDPPPQMQDVITGVIAEMEAELASR